MQSGWWCNSIWIGKVNYPKQRIDVSDMNKNDMQWVGELLKTTEDSYVKMLYAELVDNPKIRWKESIKKVLNLPDEEIG